MAKRTLSGVVPAPRATPEQMRELAAAAAALAEVAARIAESSGDRDARAAAEAAGEVADAWLAEADAVAASAR